MTSFVGASGRVRRIVAVVALAMLGPLLAVPVLSVPAAAAPPANFEDTLVTNVSGPTDVAWTPDGRMLITGKNGQLRIFQNEQLLAAPALDLTSVLCSNGERGLVGLAVHPNFADNHYVYLFYTYNKFANACPESAVDGPVGRLSRFVLPDTNVIDPSSETVLFETPPMYRDHHTAGDVKFGKDGLIYVTVGDSGAQSLNWPQDLGKLAGKIVRVTDTGAVPAGNPYTGTGTARCNVGGVPPAGSPAGTKCQEVFSSGFRNPFRFAHDPNASGVRFYVNDVGQHTWEEISEGPVAGGNYGWPLREGPCVKDSDTVCGPAPSGMIDPRHWYHHGVNGGAATAGAFVPNGVWPAPYAGSYLFADYVFGTIYQLTPGGTRCLTCAPPTSGMVQSDFSANSQVVSMRFGPFGNTQALYYVSRDQSQVRRITFTGTQNRAPVAAASASPTSGSVPLAVQFDASGSSDPDGDAISYAWDFQDDGVVDSTSVSPSYTYTTGGSVTARLTVRDPAGATGTTTLSIDPGNTAPVPVIDSPVEGSRFAVGEHFVLRGHATDLETGNLPDSALSWEVVKHHATHTHPFLGPVSGNDVPITGPEPEDIDAARTSYLEIILTATDAGGLSATTTRRLDPKFVDVTFQTEPTGRQLTVSGETITAPTTVRSWEAYNLSVTAPDQTDSTGQPWVFASWSDGGARSHAITTGATSATYSATFTQGTVSPPSTLTFTPVADTYASAEEPARNFGTRSTLRTDASPDIRSYLRFNLSGLGATVSSAKLRLVPVSGNSLGVDVRSVSDNTWGETALTFANQPGTGAVLGSSGRLTAATPVEIPISTQGIANGAFSLGVSSLSTTATSLNSREAGASTPQLIITTGGGGGPTGDTTPPTVPGNLRAVAASAGEVRLTWDPSEDAVGVTGYDVFRGGALLGSVGNLTSYSDRTVAPANTYSYQVRAKDAATNLSGLSDPASVTTPAAGGTLQLVATDDATIQQASPATNYGRASTLEVDNSPVKNVLFRFDLSSVGTQTVTRAVLRLRVTDSSSVGGSFGRMVAGSWNEGAVTWSTAPAVDTSVAPVLLGSVTSGTTVDVDVTALVNGSTLGLRVSSTSSNGADYSSREGTFAPQLVLTLG